MQCSALNGGEATKEMLMDGLCVHIYTYIISLKYLFLSSSTTVYPCIRTLTTYAHAALAIAGNYCFSANMASYNTLVTIIISVCLSLHIYVHKLHNIIDCV